MSNFNELLEAGEIDSAIQLRLDTLEHTSRGYRTDCESAKLGSALVTVLGLGMSANPLIGFIALLGSVGYGYTVLKDYRLTGRFCPLPGIRKGASQLFEAVAGAADDQGSADDPLLDVMGFLPPENAHEYELLSVSDGAICKMLGALPPAKRLAGYNFLLRRTRLLNSLHLPSMTDCKDAIALLNEAPNSSEMQQSNQPIGVNTRLGAIASSAVEVDRADRWYDDFSGSNSHRPLPTTAADLQARLKAECPELLKLVKSPPIRLVGLQRTGKSTLARKLALLRAVLMPGHKIAWSTPHFEEDNPVPIQLNPFGCSEKGKDYQAIERAWSGTQNQIDRGKRLNLTIVWDEFGGYGDGFHDPELLGASLRSLLRESTKHEYFPILVAHGDQAGFYPGVKNILGTLKESTVKVETIGEAMDDFGTMAPTGGLKILWLDGSTVTLTVPVWLTVDLLLGLLPAQPQAPTHIAEPSAATQLSTPTLPTADTYQATEKESSTADQSIKRIGAKMAEKFQSIGGDWIPVSAVARDLFNNTEDRSTARQLIDRAIASGRLESEDRENPNKTKTTFVRVSQSLFSNKKPD